MNQKVQTINGKFAEEEQKLEDAQAELLIPAEELENGQSELESGQNEAASQIEREADSSQAQRNDQKVRQRWMCSFRTWRASRQS